MLTRNKNSVEKTTGTTKFNCPAIDEKQLSVKTNEIKSSSVNTTSEENLVLILNKLSAVSDDMQGIKTSIDRIEGRISSVVEKLEGITQVVEQHTKDILLTNFSVDSLEQYTRRNNLRFFGLKETDSENVDDIIMQLIQEKLNININLVDIERAHRIGKKSATNVRPVIVKFSSYRMRELVLRARRSLKGSKIFVHEDLTKYRHDLLMRAARIFGKGKVWSRDGRIFWLEQRENGETRCTRELAEMEEFLRRVET